MEVLLPFLAFFILAGIANTSGTVAVRAGAAGTLLLILSGLLVLLAPGGGANIGAGLVLLVGSVLASYAMGSGVRRLGRKARRESD